MVRVGLIGFGLAGQAFHAPVIRGVKGMELACILERHGSRAKEKYPEVRLARTLDEMLSDKTIGLCAVATPNDSHFSYTKACLEADRDVHLAHLERRWPGASRPLEPPLGAPWREHAYHDAFLRAFFGMPARKPSWQP